MRVKIRPLLTGLLVMLLLGGSSWSAACDLSCGLRGAVPVCHGAAEQQASAGMAMSGGECNGMSSTQHNLILNSVHCGMQGCGHQLVPAQWVGEIDSGLGIVPSLVVAEIVPMTSLNLHRAMIRLVVPQGDPSGFDPLLMSLRV